MITDKNSVILIRYEFEYHISNGIQKANLIIKLKTSSQIFEQSKLTTFNEVAYEVEFFRVIIKFLFLPNFIWLKWKYQN